MLAAAEHLHVLVTFGLRQVGLYNRSGTPFGHQNISIIAPTPRLPVDWTAREHMLGDLLLP